MPYCATKAASGVAGPDYRNIPPDNALRARMRQALQSAKDEGVPRPKAVSLVAISTRESNSEWIVPRYTAVAQEECKWRVTVGIEFKAIRREADKTYLIWRDEVLADAEAVAWLQQYGMIGWSNAHGAYLAGPALKLNGDENAAFFEWVVSHQKGSVLTTFSIGATQQWMKQTPMAGYTAPCGFPTSWEDLWDLYININAGVAMQKVTYLDKGVCGAPEYPAVNYSTAKAWLMRHTGSAAGADKYLTGEGTSAPSVYAFPNALTRAQEEADAIGY